MSQLEARLEGALWKKACSNYTLSIILPLPPQHTARLSESLLQGSTLGTRWSGSSLGFRPQRIGTLPVKRELVKIYIESNRISRIYRIKKTKGNCLVFKSSSLKPAQLQVFKL